MNDGGNGGYWNTAAKEEESFGKELREIMTSIIREQRQVDRLTNVLTKTQDNG